MPAEVESMFYVGREKPWHGLGVSVEEAPSSERALILAGLDWDVIQKPIFTSTGEEIAGYRANVRSSDSRILGVVSDKYKVVQNKEAFSFTKWSLHHSQLLYTFADILLNVLILSYSSNELDISY